MRAAAFLILAVLPACGSLDRAEPFRDVERLASERGVPDLAWRTGGPEDEAVARKVDEILGRELTSDGAVAVALLNSPRLQAVYEDLSIAQADLVQAGLLRNPSVSGELRFPPTGAGNHAVELSLVQSVVELFQLPLRKRLAGAAFEAAKLRVAGEVLDVVADARAAFVDVQAAAQLREMRGTVSEALGASYELSKRLRAAGNITELDLAMDRTQFETSKIDLGVAEAELALARARLDAIMGVFGPATAWTAAGRLPDLPESEMDLGSIEKRAIGRSLDLGALRLEIAAAGESVGLARTFAFLPSLSVGATAEREPEGEWTVGPSFTIPIPIFDQGQARVATAEAQLRRIERLRSELAIEVRAAVRATRARLVSARQRVDYLRRVVLPLHQHVIDEAQLQYNAMQVGPFQLLEARRRQIEAGVRFIGDLREYWLAWIELDQLVNGRLGGSGIARGTGSRGAAAPAEAEQGGGGH